MAKKKKKSIRGGWITPKGHGVAEATPSRQLGWSIHPQWGGPAILNRVANHPLFFFFLFFNIK
jgi:hypothetical protein